MENTNKKTLKDYFNELLQIEAVASNPELVEFVNGRIALIEKKNSSPRKAKDTSYIEIVFANMEPQKVYEIDNLITEEISRGKVQYALTYLADNGKVKKIPAKKGQKVSYQKITD